MNLRVLSHAWITPLGRSAELTGAPNQTTRTNPFSGREFPCHEANAADYADASKLPRLRRSSTISLLAVSVAREAVGTADATRWGVVFASADGGIIYTRKFFDQISTQNTGAGSPLLFPETVYNAPASHVAATLGINGTVLTLSGNVDCGVQALQAAEQLLTAGVCDTCLVVAAQEVDWILCEAYSAWDSKTVLAEGAAALVVSLGGNLEIAPISPEVAAWGNASCVSTFWQVIHGLRLTSRVDRR